MSQNELFPRGVLLELCPLVAAGLSDQQIAARLKVDETAVSEYISWLSEVLGLSSRADLFTLMGVREWRFFAWP